MDVSSWLAVSSVSAPLPLVKIESVRAVMPQVAGPPSPHATDTVSVTLAVRLLPVKPTELTVTAPLPTVTSGREVVPRLADAAVTETIDGTSIRNEPTRCWLPEARWVTVNTCCDVVPAAIAAGASAR